MIEAIPMTKAEIEHVKESIRNMLRYRPAGQCYKLLTELAEEGKRMAIQYHEDKEKDERARAKADRLLFGR